MSMSLSRRSVLRLTGVAGLAGAFGAVGTQPAHAAGYTKATMIARMQSWSDKLNAAKPGYEQDLEDRWSFLNKKTRSVVNGQECDCSSSCGGIAWLAGYPIDLSPLNTNYFVSHFTAAGFTVMSYSSSKWEVGDFILAPGHHVVFARDSKRWWSAEANEHGGKTGGSDGQQKGEKVGYRAPYARDSDAANGGWKYILRPSAIPGV